MVHVQYHVSWFVPQMESGKTPDADGVFSKAPIFNFNDDKLKFDTNDVSNANDNYGTVSGFVPKYLIYTKGILLRIPFALSFCGSNPSAEHTTNFVDDTLKKSVFLNIKRFTFFH